MIAGGDPASAPPGSGQPEAPEAADPRALRASVAPTTRLEGDPGFTVAPPPDPGTRLPGSGPTPAAGDDLPRLDGRPIAARLVRFDAAHARLIESAARDAADGGRETRTDVLFGPERVDRVRGVTIHEVIVGGWRVEVELEPERRAALRERARRGAGTTARGGPLEVRAIIPGRVVAVSVRPGDALEAGQQVLVVEAMKMQNELRAPREGTVERVGVAVGDTIEVGDLLVVIH